MYDIILLLLWFAKIIRKEYCIKKEYYFPCIFSVVHASFVHYVIFNSSKSSNKSPWLLEVSDYRFVFCVFQNSLYFNTCKMQ